MKVSSNLVAGDHGRAVVIRIDDILGGTTTFPKSSGGGSYYSFHLESFADAQRLMAEVARAMTLLDPSTPLRTAVAAPSSSGSPTYPGPETAATAGSACRRCGHHHLAKECGHREDFGVPFQGLMSEPCTCKVSR